MSSRRLFIASICLNLLVIPPFLRAGGIAAKPGDVNADSSLDVRDMHGLVRIIAGRDSATAAADLDHNGRVEFRDLMLYIRMVLSMREKRPSEPQFIVAVGADILNSPAIDPGRWMEQDSTGSADFRFIADRPLQQARLYIEPVTFSGMSGSIKKIALLPDTSINSTELSSSLRSWEASVMDSSGQVSEQKGHAKFYYLKQGVMVDGVSPLTGLPIEFPLVLHGPWQRFVVAPPSVLFKEEWEPESYVVDLNPVGADRVVFNSLDSLASAVMSSLTERYPTPKGKYRTMLAGPAVPYYSTYTADRLLFWRTLRMAILRLSPCDGNYLLLQQLGLPGWFRAEYPRVHYQKYWLPLGWLEKYGNK
jgi:hypothetical protein